MSKLTYSFEGDEGLETVEAELSPETASTYADLAGGDLIVTFENRTGERHNGCAAIGYYKTGGEKMDGIRPVNGNETRSFNLGPCSGFSQWRFIASIDYSDKPENLKVVMIDTGKRPVTKCDWTITGEKQ